MEGFVIAGVTHHSIQETSVSSGQILGLSCNYIRLDCIVFPDFTLYVCGDSEGLEEACVPTPSTGIPG